MTSNCNNRWIFDEIQLNASPSRADHIGHNEELLLRQKGTNFIREIAELLKLKPICMNTAIVYLHRFFMIRSLKRFDINQISVCCLFLASKFEEQPIFKDHLLKVSHLCQNKSQPINEEEYKRECDKLIENENEMLLTFGFDLSVKHAHSVIINASHKSVINKTICQKAYLIANDLLRLTTLCLQYSPPFIACVCIQIASYAYDIPITTNNEKKDWSQLINDSETNLRLEDVEEVAQKYRRFINVVKPQNNVQQKKRTLSYDDNYSPESAYSSSSGNSPIYDTLVNQRELSSNPTNGHSSDKHLNKNSIYKRIRSEQSSAPSHSILKPKCLLSKNSSIIKLSNSYSKQSLTNTKQIQIPCNSSIVRNNNNNNNNNSLRSDLSIAKTFTSNIRNIVNKDKDLLNLKNNAITNFDKTAESTMSSLTESIKTTNSIKIGKKCFNPKNFTITFSNDSFKDKSNETSKSSISTRIVRETGNGIVKIES